MNIKCDFSKQVLPQFRKLVQDTIKAVSRKIDPQRRQFTFEIFGYDFMLDEDLVVAAGVFTARVRRFEGNALSFRLMLEGA